jgi:hypothetical protein
MVNNVFIWLLFASCTVAAVVNKEVSRVVDASTSVVRITTEIKATNVENEYQLIFPHDAVKKLAFLSVTINGKELFVNAPVS